MEFEEIESENSTLADRALIVGGDETMRRVLDWTLRESNWEVTVYDAEEYARWPDTRWLLVLICVGSDGAGAVETLEQMHAEIAAEQTYAVVISKQPSQPDLLDCMKRGATDYLAWPVLPIEIEEIANRARKVAQYELMLQKQGPQPTIQIKSPADNNSRLLIGNSPAMIEIFKQIAKIASTPGMRVLITGETGTGKEVVARQIHELSGCRGPFRAVNCAATPENLLESDLFGHEKGAFTGAHQMKKGLWEAAAEGTLFLDEIAETSLSVQAKLLRALQEGVIRRVGSNQEIKVTARVIAASNKNVEKAVEDGTFREDLFYRFGQLLPIPPLRERREDIPILVEHFRRCLASKKVITQEALDALYLYDWPGNVRQLESVASQLLLFYSRFIFREDVGHHIPIVRTPEEVARKTLNSFWSTSRRLKRGEWPTVIELRNWYVHQVYGVLGKESAVAKALGLDVRTVCAILRKEDEQKEDQ